MFDPSPPPRRGLGRWRRGGNTDGDDLPTGPSLSSAQLALAVLVGVVLLGCGFAFWHGEDEIKADRDRAGVTELSRGQCVNEVNDRALIGKVTVVDCAEPHEAEVFATLRMREWPEYPHLDEIDQEISPQCLDAFEDYAPGFVDEEAIEINYIFPDILGWNAGDRGVSCLAGDPASKRSGSLH